MVTMRADDDRFDLQTTSAIDPVPTKGTRSLNETVPWTLQAGSAKIFSSGVSKHNRSVPRACLYARLDSDGNENHIWA